MISVVIPLYNKAHTIEKTLGSVIAQTYINFEVVIVDDGSTDDGVEVIKNFTNDKRVRIISQPNQGVSVARNQGVQHSTFNYIAFLDGDDEWDQNYLFQMNQAIVKFPTVGLICSAGKIRSGGNEYLRLAKKYEGLITEVDFFENPHVFLHTSATVVSKKEFNRTDGFPIGMKRNQDFALFFSLALITKVVYSGIPLSVYVGDVEGQATKTSFKEVLLHVTKRYNEVFNNWKKNPRKNKSFIIFMKYELRHTFLSFIKANNHDTLIYFMDGLQLDIRNQFNSLEWYMLTKKPLKPLNVLFIYATKVRWRLRGYPRVQ
ncbi:glycosyltransferase family 2 protein [Sediminicola luteus]|uniref:Glycosyltransferase family 2 protein n=1 Tax=Sediminicola luteus TaxID=319238 RepID=A0ABV2TXS5_9FLAO